MSQPLRWGMTIPLDGPLHAQRDRIVELESLGYTDVWSAEADGHDAFTPLTLASVWAPSLRLGTAIVPAYTRGRATLAQSVGSMAQAAPGRFVPVMSLPFWDVDASVIGRVTGSGRLRVLATLLESGLPVTRAMQAFGDLFGGRAVDVSVRE